MFLYMLNQKSIVEKWHELDISIVLKNVEECRNRYLTKDKKSDKIDIIDKEKTKENNH